jgi:sulfotransferase family protein
MTGVPSKAEASRLPNLLITGVSKAGTTSLFNYLAQHPAVCASDVKELRYFTPLRYGEAPGPLSDYTTHFRHCRDEPYALEATPGYFYGGRDLAGGILSVCPAAHAIVSLREPKDRCWSWFQFVKSRTRIPREMTFSEYLDKCEELRLAGTDGALENQAFWGLGGGCYANWLDDWVELFGPRFRIVFFDDIVQDPRNTIRLICEWLLLDVDVVDDFQFPVDNKTVQYQNRMVQKAAVALNRRGERFFHRHRTTKRLLRRAYYSLNRAPSGPAMTASERNRLADFYGPYNARLSEQLAVVGLGLPASWSGID